ncbi:hypothetical protein DMJ13_05280 [halophilic archaeon]|nr:hypothetical protein DMJ13_05280 [halophilic archaeon]
MAGNGGPTTGHDSDWTQVAQRHYDPDDDNGELTTALVFAIADAKGIAPTDLKSPPVYDCIDAAALEETFFGPDLDGESRHGVGTVEFRYDGYLVQTKSDGWIQVYEPADTNSSEA